MNYSFQAIIQTLLLLGVIICVFILIQLGLYAFGIRSSKSRFITAIIALILTTAFVYYDYPISHLFNVKTKLNLEYIQPAMFTMIWMCIAILITSGLNYFIWEGVSIRNGQMGAPRLLTKILNVIIFFIISLIIAKLVYQIDITNLLAASGLGAFILGWSAKTTLSDLFAGLALQLGGKMKKGAYIKVDDKHGIIKEFDWRTISLIPVSQRGEILDSETIIIPNSKLQSQVVEILKQPKVSQLVIKGSLNVSPYCDLAKVEKILYNLLLEYSLPHDISISFNTSLKDTIEFYFQIKVHSLKNKLRFSEAFQISINHRLMKANLPISRSERPWSIQDNSDEPAYQQYQPIPPTQEHILEILTNNDTFKSLDDNERHYLIEKGTMEYFLNNEFIIHERVHDECQLYILIQGSAESYEHDNNNDAIKMRDINYGDSFGIQAFLLESTRRISVKTTQACWCLKISRETIKPVLKNNRAFIDQLSEILATRIKQNRSTQDNFLRTLEQSHESSKTIILRKIKMLFL
ncbi:MAG: hypothetical protein CL816_05065 [Coxiellaceae bacterium]|nr:hypothetical protein [Coxiellaceae bacterium]|tara:strand:+ start:2111 stop:3673 length:1563 start_codon:yes stop_codon:yes gene_type:complete